MVTYEEGFIDGFASIPELLPRPTPIQILDGGFVYVSIREILRYHLANGQPLDPLVDLPYHGTGSQHSLHASSNRGKELLAAVKGEDDGLDPLPNHQTPSKYPTAVSIWSDGFDPNSTRRNRGSAHIVLISIGAKQDHYHSGWNTYCVSIGPATGDISVVSARLASEMQELCDECLIENVYFDLNSGRELSIFLRVFGFLQDRPERCHWL